MLLAQYPLLVVMTKEMVLGEHVFVDAKHGTQHL
jgi:hypothetical protein